MTPDTDAAGKATPLCACVITYQEESRITDCLRSLSFCDDILVVVKCWRLRRLNRRPIEEEQ